MRRKIVLLLATVGATLGLVLSSPAHANLMEQPRCDARVLNGAYEGKSGGGPNGYSSGDRHRSFLENDAEQKNENLCQQAYNHPEAFVWNENKNINPQFSLFSFHGGNSQTNNQSNRTWIDQSQEANALQANVAFQSISANWGPPGGGAPGAFVGGGGPPPIENDADQTNENLTQTAQNRPEAWVFNKNVNFNPQIALVGNNTQSNTQSNSTWIDQSQEANAAQVNVAGQSIDLGAPIDPVNEAEQENGTLNQQANNEPKSVVGNENVNFNPQFTLVGSNTQTNNQSNHTGIDQSQEANAGQANLAGQSIDLG